MNQYHYIDDQGNISDPLPLAALQKIGLPPATKVLLEGSKQWTTLEQASQGGAVVFPVAPAAVPPASPPPTPPTPATATIKLNCQSCNTEKSMIPTKVGKFGGVVKFIGWLIVIPSVLGVVICIISAFMVAGQPGDSQADQVGKGGAEVLFFFFAGVSLVGGLIGWILISKKKVFKCSVCGSIKDRD